MATESSDVAVTGKGARVALSMPRTIDDTQLERDSQNVDAIDIVVYFSNNVGLQLKVCDGQNLTATELFEDVMEERNYPAEARQLFSLWLVSDLLELQMKPTHIPFKLVCYWEELLEKYSSASEYDRQRDEPVIAFRRNIFCSLDEEKQILRESASSTELMCLLYHEAKKNLLTGRYPLTQDECDQLAAIQIVVSRKEQQQSRRQSAMEPTEYTIDFFRKKMFDYLPAHYCKRNRLFNTGKNPERRLMDSYSQDNAKYESMSLEELYKCYLDMCYHKPYYGCAFFRGQVEHPGRRLMSTRIDDPVYVAINTEGVYVIDEDDFVMLIGLPYRHLCWERAETSSSEHSDQCLPCLFLQFPVAAVQGNESSTDTQVLQIFSREAILMDRLIDACVQLKKTQPVTDDGRGEHVIHGQGEVVLQFQRLALMTFGKNHKPVGKKSSIRMPKNSKPNTSSTASA